jgi:hypothetical protein
MQDESSKSTGPASLDGKTSEDSPTPTRSTIGDELKSILSPEDSPARISRAHEPTEPALGSLETSPVFGRNSDESSGCSALDSFSWKIHRPGNSGHPLFVMTCSDSVTALRRSNWKPLRSGLRTQGQEFSLLPTPTATANHLAPSMRQYPAYLRLQNLVGTGGAPDPNLWAWMMGFPPKWCSVLTETPSSPKSPNGSANESSNLHANQHDIVSKFDPARPVKPIAGQGNLFGEEDQDVG